MLRAESEEGLTEDTEERLKECKVKSGNRSVVYHCNTIQERRRVQLRKQYIQEHHLQTVTHKQKQYTCKYES